MNRPANDNDDASASFEESRVTEAVDEFIDAVNRGEEPAIDEFAGRYPEIADVLRGVLPALGVIRQGALPATPTKSAKNAAMIGGCLGDYRILREIGRGGMGVVYEAEQISLQRRVALKVLPFAAALDAKRLERFKNEAQAAARLHHSNIVPVHAVGCERGVYYYAMQMIDGESLADVIQQLRQLSRSTGPEDASGSVRGAGLSATTEALTRTPCVDENGKPPPSDDLDLDGASPEIRPRPTSASSTVHGQATRSTMPSTRAPTFFKTAARLGIQAAEALEHAHGHAIVHRDVKPANLLIDIQGQLWVTDFGLARLLSDAGLTVTGDVMGTLRYMSPEQANGAKTVIDHRTDIYSLGATLYELLTLQPVFDGDSREELLRHITSDEPRAPRRLNSSIPTDLETIVLKALAKEPHGRYATAQELADDLRRFLDSRPIRAKRPTMVELASKWSRRHRPVVVSAVVVLFLAVVGLAVSNVLISGLNNELAHKQAATVAALASKEEQRERAEAALISKEEQRNRAEQNFQQTREVLEFFMQLSEDELAHQEELQDVRAKFLQASLNYYQQFIEQSGDDPPLQAELARSHLQVAKILYYEMGSTPAAEEAIEQALQTQERLVLDNPDDGELRDGLREMYWHLGVMRGGLQFWVVRQDSVQEHLRLTEDQVSRIEEIAEAQSRRFKELLDSRNVDLSKTRREYPEHVRAAQQAAAEVLDARQATRLDQLVLQWQRTSVFHDPVVAEKLQITAAQKSRIRTIQDDACRGGDPKRAVSCDRQIFDVLTDSQKTQWTHMVGEPFEWRKGRRPRRRD